MIEKDGRHKASSGEPIPIPPELLAKAHALAVEISPLLKALAKH